ncbi:35718_t:CDS:1, partial [Racocetra persica]
MFDEYPIENFYSLLRRQTKDKVNTPHTIRRDAIFVDNLRNEDTFVDFFVPKKDYPYKKKDLDVLSKSTAIFLLEFFSQIWNNDYVEKKIEGTRVKKIYYYFSNISSRFSSGILPLGYHSLTPPKQEKFCDRINCNKTDIGTGQVLICGHAYHDECFKIMGFYCDSCFKYLCHSIDELANSYNERLQLDENLNEKLAEDNNNKNED